MEAKGVSGAALGRPWQAFGHLNCVLVASWGRLGGFGRRLEANLVRLGGFRRWFKGAKASPRPRFRWVRRGFWMVFCAFSRSEAKIEN